MEINEKMHTTTAEKIVADTSVIVLGTLSSRIRAGKIKGLKILVPKAAIDELQAQASRGQETGFKVF